MIKKLLRWLIYGDMTLEPPDKPRSLEALKHRRWEDEDLDRKL